MLRVNKLTDYAIIMLCYMAKYKGSQLFSSVIIAEQLAIALPTVSKILKILQKQHIVVSKQGANGGYRLAVAADKITVAQIISVMEGQLGITECSLAKGICEYETMCSLRGNWQKINHAVISALDNVTVADMASDTLQPQFDLHTLKHARHDELSNL